MRRSSLLLVILLLVFAMLRRAEGAGSCAALRAANGIAPAAQQGGGSPAGGEPAPAPGAAVRNSSPEIRGVRFVGGDGRPGNTLGVEAEGYDADGDAVQFEIAWQKNGQPAGTGNRLAAPVKRGDKVTVTITPFDGKERGKSATLSGRS